MPADIVTEIERIKPHHLRVLVEGEQEHRRIAVPKRRNRWAAVGRVLDALTWVEVEACDPQGGVLALFRADDAPRPVETALAPAAEQGGGVTLREVQLVDLVVTVQRETLRALTAVQAEARAATEATTGQLQAALTAGLQSIVELQRAQAEMWRGLLRTQVEAAAASEDDGIGVLAPLVSAVVDVEARKKAAERKQADRPPAKKPAPSRG